MAILVSEEGPSYTSQAAVLLLYVLFAFALPNISTEAINIRRALKRYDAQLTYPTPSKPSATEDQAPANKKFGGLIIGLSAIFIAYASCIVFLNLLEFPKKISFLGPHSFSVFLGIVLSSNKPFAYPARIDVTYYIRRVKNKKPGKAAPTLSAVHEIVRTNRKTLSAGMYLLVEMVRAIVLGIVTLKTGLLIPSIFLIGLAFHIATILFQGWSLRAIFLSIVAFWGSIVALVLALIMPMEQYLSNDDKTQVASKPSSSPFRLSFPSIIEAFSTLNTVIYSLLPALAVIAAARNYDLQRLEATSNGLEGEIQLLRDDLPEMKPLTHPVPVLDENGKRPEPLADANVLDPRIRIGRHAFQIHFWTGSGRSAHSRSTLDLPTLDCAIVTAQVAAIATWTFTFAQAFTVKDNNGSTGSWIGQHIRLSHLFSEDVLTTDWSSVSDDVILLAGAWGLFLVLVLTATVSVSVFSQDGWQGLKTIWTKGDNIWFEGPRSVELAPEEDVSAEKESDAVPPLILIDAAED